jgi:hypothetical protein
MSLSLADADRQLTAAGQLFATEEAVVDGVATRVWKNCPATLGDILTSSRRYEGGDFLVYEDERTAFESHFQRVAHLAQILRTRFGVQNGDRVAIAMRNLPDGQWPSGRRPRPEPWSSLSMPGGRERSSTTGWPTPEAQS